ncbi:hypothetical protein PVA19_00615 [Agrobacterium sp. CNPSo 3708]|uniref:hypothetical protein n=1 Tax=unclassified Agrobacterium TaxID=2632611 RepID=UPI0023643C08|nr:hypothetical protein [Agrobacterium sp. CNPSo 3708]MDD1496899.1 hypothetical protein [Agrobacterium sp. CNPSo 3708]
MTLATLLGVQSADDLDPSRPISLGRFELGVEATGEATKILRGEVEPPVVNLFPRNFTRQAYWSISHKTAGEAELFGVPGDETGALATALEVALVRAAAGADAQDHSALLQGNVEVRLGPRLAWEKFSEIIGVVEKPLVGESLLFGGATQAVISDQVKRLNQTCISCLANSFRTSPLKFRFLELYRMIEALFLAQVKEKLFASFDAEPSGSIQEAADALKSEMAQIRALAEQQQDAFVACRTALYPLRQTNRFAAALFKKVKGKGLENGSQWEVGAALVYQVRCAVVHAGQKDIIFESYPDGDEVIAALIPGVERAALELVGVQLV